MAEKRFYWLKFRSDFFDSKRIKKLRNMAGGYTYCIIYLKMQLKALKSDGILEFTGIEDQFADELALDIDERPDDVRVTLMFLLQYGLCECSDNIHYFLPYVIENTGSEGESAQRVREYRERQKALPSNTSVTEVKRDCNSDVTACNTEIDIDKNVDTETDTRAEKKQRQKQELLSEAEQRFEEFWDEYPRREKKKEAKALWVKLKLTDDLFDRIMDGLRQQKASDQWQTPKFIPQPTKWIRGEEWENEPLPSRASEKAGNRYSAIEALMAQTIAEEGGNT